MPSIDDFGRVTKQCSDCSLFSDGYYHCTMNCSGRELMPTIETHFIYPPIPLRQFDWCAYYEGDEPNDAGQMKVGYGKTEYDAIVDLLTNYPRSRDHG